MIRLAILSDIHSNSFALQAVIEHARNEGVSQFVNLGDILYGPIAPRATYDLLRPLNVTTICGNQDRQIFQATESELNTNPTLQFILDDLGNEPQQWMQKLPFDYQITPQIYACHGTPIDDLTYLLEDTQSGYPQLRADREIIRLLAGNTSPIVLCGHTHIPRCVELSTGQIVINPGSVGLPAYADEEPHYHQMETYSSHASYAILMQTQIGQWHVAFHRVKYDVDAAVQQAVLRNRQDWGHYLSTGRSS
ncbi:metallophosphoesterase family protein [Vibrio taketomensis]|uniref:metallophosphoesterase family protein n=1 Tax=Vibrio taketomensis TaxID=2572923 RepID=UPI00138A0575|nr:metallophosphoesterase family protein [Vibrio taketomensis]